MSEDLDNRINNLIEALNENLHYQPPSGLELLVELLAKRADDEMMSEMQMRG